MPYINNKIFYIYHNIQTDRPEQPEKTLIKLLLKEQFDQGLLCLPYGQNGFDISGSSQTDMFKFFDEYGKATRCPNI